MQLSDYNYLIILLYCLQSYTWFDIIEVHTADHTADHFDNARAFQDELLGIAFKPLTVDNAQPREAISVCRCGFVDVRCAYRL